MPPTSRSYLPLTSGAIVKLNLKAAIKSKNTSAFSQALICVDVGMQYVIGLFNLAYLYYIFSGLSILKSWDNSWQDCYDLSFALYSLKAEISYLTGDYTGAEALYPMLLQQARTVKDKSSVHLIMYYQFELQVQLFFIFYDLCS